MFLKEFLVIHGTAISRTAPTGSLLIKDCKLFIYFFVCREQCYNIFLTKDCVALFLSLEKCDFEKNPLKDTLMQI